MPTFNNLESLDSVRTKINNAILETEQNTLDIVTLGDDIDVGVAAAEAAAAAALVSKDAAAVSATIATDQATISTTKASEASVSAVSASSSAATATTQAGNASTSAGLAASSEATATTQAGIATAKAAEAAASAANSLAFLTRADFIVWLATNTPPVGTTVLAEGLRYKYIGTGTAITDAPGYVPNGIIFVDHFKALPDGTTDNTVTIKAAHDYVKSLGGGKLYFNTGVYLFSSLLKDGDNVTWCGQGSGYKNAEFTQKDKAKVIASASTVFRYNGPANGLWIDCRPTSFFARNKAVGGGMQDVLLDSLTGTNKAGIALLDRNVEHSLYRDVVFLGATSYAVGATGMLTGFSTGDNNSAYTKFDRCLFLDKVVLPSGTNSIGGGNLLVLGAEFNHTNPYLDHCHFVSSSPSITEVHVENCDHAHFENIRCNTGGMVIHADDTGVYNVLRMLRYKNKANGGFTVGNTVTGASSGATGVVAEVREGGSTGFGAVFLSGYTGIFTAGENLQVAGTTRGVGENRTHLKTYDVVGAISAGDTIVGATSGASMLVDEVFTDTDGLCGVLFANAGSVTGVFAEDELLQVLGVTRAKVAETQQAIGVTSFWSTQRNPSSYARFIDIGRYFGKLTYKASVSGTSGTKGNILRGYAVVDPFSIGLPTIEVGSTEAKSAQVLVTVDSLPGEAALGTVVGMTYGRQAADATVSLGSALSHTTSGSWQTVAWDTETHDPMAAVDLPTFNTRVTIPGGVYRVRVTGAVRFPANATGQRGVRTLINGTQPVGSSELLVNAASAGVTTLNLNTAWVAVVPGQKIEMATYQSSGGALNMNATATFMQVEFG